MIPIMPISVRDTTQAAQLGASRASQARQDYLNSLRMAGQGFGDLAEGTGNAVIMSRLKAEEDEWIREQEAERQTNDWISSNSSALEKAGITLGSQGSSYRDLSENDRKLLDAVKTTASMRREDEEEAASNERKLQELEDLADEEFSDVGGSYRDRNSTSRFIEPDFDNVGVLSDLKPRGTIIPNTLSKISTAPSKPRSIFPTTVARAAEAAGINTGYMRPSDLDRLRREQGFEAEQAALKAAAAKTENLQKFIDSQHNTLEKEYGDLARGIDNLNKAIASNDKNEIAKSKNSLINQKIKQMAGSAVTPLEFARQMGALLPPNELENYYAQMSSIYNVDRERIIDAINNPSWDNLKVLAITGLSDRMGAPGSKTDAALQNLTQRTLNNKVDPQWLAQSFEESLPKEYRALEQAYNATRGKQFGFGQGNTQQGNDNQEEW